MKDTILEMRNVTKRFPGVLALSNVCIRLGKGEILGICGENGAGKSTLMKVLSGSYSAKEYEGEILIDGQPVRFTCVEDAQKHGIEMVYQELNMILDLSVAENLFVGNLPMKAHSIVDYPKLYTQAEKLLKEIQFPISPKTHVRLLNSGQMQLLAIMRACAKNPKILIMDEPTSALTEREVDVLMDLLDRLRERGISVIYISHKLDEVYRICDRVTVIRDGQTISDNDIENIKEQTLIEDMVGRKVENLYPKEKTEIGGEVLRVEHLTVPHPNIRGKNIIEDISFHLNKGEILGIGGLVGAGRSEALGAIFGQYSNVKKEVYIDGKKVRIRHPLDAIRHGIGFITEERKLTGYISMLSIRENMSIASLRKLSGRVFMKRKLEKGLAKKQFSQLRIKAPSMETKLFQLSGGNQQKVILGKWLTADPEILFIDEPTKGVDVGTKADFYQIMNDLTKRGVSIVMVSSDMPELISMSDRCIVISEGKITAELTGDEINENNVMKAAIALQEEENDPAGVELH